MKFQGNTFLISGGSSGLGGATATWLVNHGANVVILDINEESGKQKVKSLGDKSRFIKADVTSESQVQAAVDLAKETFGGLQGLVNAAGIVVASKVLDREGNPHRLDLFARGINVNLIGTFNAIRLAAQAMAENEPNADDERGVIVNTSSVAAFEGQIGQASYAASKAAIIGMTLPIAREFSRQGIRVCTVAPGIFETPILDGLSDEIKESLGQQVPFPSRLGKPEEFASLVGHIIENVMLNGEVIRLDGAIRMTPK